METQATPRPRLHPLVAAAAVAVTIASAIAVGAMTGFLPSGAAKQTEHGIVAQAPAATFAMGPTFAPQPVAVAAPEQSPTPVDRPAAKAAPKPKVVHPVAQAPVRTAQSPTQRPPVMDAPNVEPDPYPVTQAPSPRSYPGGSSDYRPAPVVAQRRVCYDCGTVESLREITNPGEGTGLGAVAGGISGLILGKQVGNGKGSKIASVLGAAGGAYAGHQIEKHTRTSKAYEVSVRMEDGAYRTVALDSQSTWRAGDHVRLINGVLQPDNR